MRLTLAALAVLALVLAVGSMWNDSATADEGAHIASGILKLREGRVDFYATQAPLAEAILAAPVAWVPFRTATNRPWLAGRELLYRSGWDAHTLLTLARLPAIAMFIATALLVFFFVRRVTGDDVAALIGFALTAFCPTLLAHGRLATVDIGVTFFTFAAACASGALAPSPAESQASGLRSALAGVLVACALASKVSAIILVPYLLLLAIWRRRNIWREAVVALLAFVAIYLLLARSLDVTLPFRMYFSELRAVGQLYGNQYVLPQFLLGRFSHRGWPYYNLVAFAVKTPLPVLILLFFIRRIRFEAAACFAFVVMFFAASAFSSLNLGIRHILPVFPFLYAGLAIALPKRRIVYALVAWHVVTAVIAFPSYIAYFNPLIGSHRNADRVLIDSNLDWGQDLHRLAMWSRERGIEGMRVHYFGAGDVAYEFGTHAQRWPGPGRTPLPPGWLAVSRHFYRLSFDREISSIDYDAYLRASGARFVTSIGGSIDVYRIDYDRAH